MPSVSAAQDRETGDEQAPDMEQILRDAKPAPNPPGVDYSPTESRSLDRLDWVEYDPATGKETVRPFNSVPLERALPRDESSEGLPISAPPLQDQDEGGDDDRDLRSITPTPPTPRKDVRNFPFNTIYKMLMRFNVGGEDYYYVCSAESVGEFHLMTAGHCIYNWDPNGDGSTSDNMWANEVWVWAAQSDLQAPHSIPDRPYGAAKMTYMHSYSGWTVSQDKSHDWAVITLDRRVADHTGWMGRESDHIANSLNFSGYPTETPYVPDGVLVQYDGYDSGNVRGYTDYRIPLDAFIYGGHSGGPGWRYNSSLGERYIQGINSTSNRTGYAELTLLTEGKRDRINIWMSEDARDRPPAARPDIVESVFANDFVDYKYLHTSMVVQGGSFGITYNARNVGHAATGTVTIDFYLSTNDNISYKDRYLGTRTFSSLGVLNGVYGSTNLTIPADTTPGDYYIGYLLRTATAEYSNNFNCTERPCDNRVVIGNQVLTVTPAVTKRYTLAVSRTGTGTGTVTSKPAGIDCGLNCKESYDSGTSVALSATASFGSFFAGWGGDNGCSTGIVSMLNDMNCTATFTAYAANYTLNVAKVGSGTVISNPVGINCGSDCTEVYKFSTLVSLTAKPAAGYSFSGWSGDADCSDGSVSMTGNRNCKATFLKPDQSCSGSTVEIDQSFTSGTHLCEGTTSIKINPQTDVAVINQGTQVQFLAPIVGLANFKVGSGAIFRAGPAFTPGCTDPTDSDGDRLRDCVETNSGVFVSADNTGTNPNVADTDGDSIKDGDEVLGTLAGLNLPALGANPLRKNILLEYDWFNDSLECGAHSHRPSSVAVSMVAAAFAAAPVSNPDGTTGITVIQDYGQGGAFTGGNLVNDADGVLTEGVSGAEYLNHKAGNFVSNRNGYFHYVLLPHNYNTNSPSSGQAEVSGDDLIISLQCSSTWSTGDASYAHTIMHELGHNLSLRHGGVETLNYKPNYNSIMNYKYQFPGIDLCSDADPDGNGILNYSIGDRINLNENSLDERAGTCGAGTSPAYDWDRDGTIESSVVKDINCDSGGACDGILQTLEDYNDWAHIYFAGLFDADGAEVPRTIEVVSCDNPAPAPR